MLPSGIGMITSICRLSRQFETGASCEVFHNLAVAENKLGFRESACTALRRGLSIDASHAGLQRLAREFGLREQQVVISVLPREHMLNRILGRFFRGTRKPRPERNP